MAEVLNRISLVLVFSGLLLSAFRMIRGPSHADRITALDSMTIMTVSIIGAVTLTSGRLIYLDVALVYGLVSFVGVVALARYLERGL